jgi:hypothetical protein
MRGGLLVVYRAKTLFFHSSSLSHTWWLACCLPYQDLVFSFVVCEDANYYTFVHPTGGGSPISDAAIPTVQYRYKTQGRDA